MTNATISRFGLLSTVFAASVALIATGNVASAKGHYNGNIQNNNVSPHFVITGQPASVKRALSDHKERKERHADKKKRNCERITVPTAGCAISPNDPVGSVHTGGITGGSSTGGNAGTKAPSPSATTVTLSNGVIRSAIENGKGITVTSNSPGTITISNGNSSVTMAGGSLTLHGAQSVSAGSGLQLIHLSNGDVSIAVSPILMGGPSQSRPVSSGVTFGDGVKTLGATVGDGVATVATGTVLIPGSAVTLAGSVVASPFTGHPVEFVKDAASKVVDKVGDAIDWASNLF